MSGSRRLIAVDDPDLVQTRSMLIVTPAQRSPATTAFVTALKRAALTLSPTSGLTPDAAR